MKRRQLVLTCALVLALSSGVVFTACSPNIFGLPSPEEIAAQKEAEEKKAALAPFVGIWEAKSIEDQKNGTVTEDMYKDVRDVYLAIYGYDFSDDGTGLFVRFGAQKPFTWSVDADGKLTITLAGNAGSYTASVDSSGQMTVEGSDGSKAILTRVSTTSGDYSHIRYEPFNPLTGTGNISKNKSSHETKLRFTITTELDQVIVDTDELYVRLIGIASLKDLKGFEGYVFEVINRTPYTTGYQFTIQDPTDGYWAYGFNVLEPGERVYEYVLNNQRRDKSLSEVTDVKGTLEYDHSSNGALHNDEKTVTFDLPSRQSK